MKSKLSPNNICILLLCNLHFWLSFCFLFCDLERQCCLSLSPKWYFQERRTCSQWGKINNSLLLPHFHVYVNEHVCWVCIAEVCNYLVFLVASIQKGFSVVKMFNCLKKYLCLGEMTVVLHRTALLVLFFSVFYNLVNSGLITWLWLRSCYPKLTLHFGLMLQ